MSANLLARQNNAPFVQAVMSKRQPFLAPLQYPAHLFFLRWAVLRWSLYGQAQWPRRPQTSSPCWA